MRPSLLVVGTVAAAVLAAPILPATADPVPPTPPRPAATAGQSGEVREQVPDTVARPVDLRRATRAARSARAARAAGRSGTEGAGFDTPLVMPSSYPFQSTLPEPEPEPLGSDASTLSGVLAHSDLAPQVNDWMAQSDLVSAQVVGRSVQGRDLYLVTVTAPETPTQTAQQAAWKDEIRNDPTTAAADAALQTGYKTPIWFSANIHGNEWEGTDGIMGYIADLLAAEDDPATQALVAAHRLYFYLTINPDGRTIGQRPGVLGLDINRDMITSTTPESVAFTKVARAVQPLYSADLHGYTNVLQVEPCGPPHGDNYEYDLFIGHGYAAALQVEREMLDAAIPGNPLPLGQITIPYRDTPSGWDDYPPVFTAQYTAYYGAVTSTVELPLPRTGTTQNPVTAAVNTAVATQTITSLVDYVSTHSDEMLDNQIEVFRRGEAGAPKVQLTGAGIAAVPGPAEWKPLWDVADDQNPVDYPRAYVIPRGADQRSQSDADRVVEHLLFNEIEVGTLDAATTVGGTTYPAGSYVVDMHQPLRGLANALLDVGYDISDKVPSMYDVSAWSYSYLWGASVDPVGTTSDAPLGATTPITAPTPAPAAPTGPRTTVFDLAGLDDHRALHDLLDTGATVNTTPTGAVVVPASAYAAAVTATAAHGVELRTATPAEVAAAGGDGARILSDLHVGYVGTQEDTLALTQMGLDDLEVLDSATISAASLADVDVLWVGSDLGVTAGSAADTALRDWVAGGHSIVGRDTAGLDAAEQYGLLSATATSGVSSSNGIVALTTPAGSPLAPHAQDSAFVYPAVSFTDLGAGTDVAQSYAADPFLAGHWRPSSLAADDGPDFAAGKAAVISAVRPNGSRALVFGTSVFFRTHTVAGIGQGARAIEWAASAPAVPLPPDPVTPGTPVATITGVRQTSSATYPDRARVVVAVAPADGTSGTPTGRVVVRDTTGVLARGPLAGGRVTLTLPARRPGTQEVTASFVPATASYAASTSTPARVVTRKAASGTTTRITQLAGPRIRVTVGLLGGRAGVPTGQVRLLLDGEVLRRLTARVSDAGQLQVVLRLTSGRHRLQARYLGSGTLRPSRSATRTVSARGR
ncbi:M14 family zinc carboxypeptidase [Nocardioides rubriscoriae]|uniref:M14 family zinc carboxypeptidase n=1 Tax=Nocardioides rubriscoriae TaxID=642762 RepID=UPI0011DF5561|nr:M14 family zinc carboxypeptidase [Nocardioides rubriscoriae]